ncbi:MAG: hypothetical protein ACLQU2_09485, partial [Candidatus Binataceae bacterium]
NGHDDQRHRQCKEELAAPRIATNTPSAKKNDADFPNITGLVVKVFCAVVLVVVALFFWLGRVHDSQISPRTRIEPMAELRSTLATLAEPKRTKILGEIVNSAYYACQPISSMHQGDGASPDAMYYSVTCDRPFLPSANQQQ